VRNTDLQHTSSKIFRNKLFSGIDAPYVPNLWSEIWRVKSFWRKIEYTNLACAFLSYGQEEKSSGNGEALSRHRQIMPERYWYFQPCAWKSEICRWIRGEIFVLRFAGIVISHSRIVNFHKWSIWCIFKL